MTPILDRAGLPSIARVATGDRARMVYAQSHFDTGIWRIELAQPNAKSTPSEAKATPFVLSTVQEFCRSIHRTASAWPSSRRVQAQRKFGRATRTARISSS
jgi:hypothetical protein